MRKVWMIGLAFLLGLVIVEAFFHAGPGISVKHLGIPADGGERILKFMGNAGGHLTQCSQIFLNLESPAKGVGLGNIFQHADHAVKDTVRISQWGQIHIHKQFIS